MEAKEVKSNSFEPFTVEVTFETAEEVEKVKDIISSLNYDLIGPLYDILNKKHQEHITR